MQATTCFHDGIPNAVLQKVYLVFHDAIAFHTTNRVFDTDSDRRDLTMVCFLQWREFTITGLLLRLDDRDAIECKALEPKILIATTAAGQGRAHQSREAFVMRLPLRGVAQEANMTGLIAHEEVFGSPGTAVMGSRYHRAREHPCERMAAQVHGESRDGPRPPGAAERARGSGPLPTEDRTRARAPPRREHPRRDPVPPRRSSASRPARAGCGRGPSPAARVRRARRRRASAHTGSRPLLGGPPAAATTGRVGRAASPHHDGGRAMGLAPVEPRAARAGRPHTRPLGGPARRQPRPLDGARG